MQVFEFRLPNPKIKPQSNPGLTRATLTFLEPSSPIMDKAPFNKTEHFIYRSRDEKIHSLKNELKAKNFVFVATKNSINESNKNFCYYLCEKLKFCRTIDKYASLTSRLTQDPRWYHGCCRRVRKYSNISDSRLLENALFEAFLPMCGPFCLQADHENSIKPRP